MKKLILPFALVAFISCGGNKNATAENTTKTDSINTEATETTAAKGNPNVINPVTADFSKPLDVATLHESMTCYYNKTVKLIVYPNTYPGKQKWANYLRGSLNSTDDKVQLQLVFKTVPIGEFTSATPYIVKCKIVANTFENRLDLSSVELLGELKDAKADMFQANAIDSAKLYAVEDVYKNITAWKDKKVIVIGNYNGTTTSYDYKDKSKILDCRIDMTSSTQGFENAKVGFSFPSIPENSPAAGKQNVTIEGTINGFLPYSAPYLINCTIK